jgi:hypothetical protein
MEELKKSILTGINGYKAMSIQVLSLMWLRTIMNYQYKTGLKLNETIKLLYKEGGIKRFYSGIIPALIHGPLCRFGDTFSNALILNILKTKNIPIFFKTGFASLTAGLVRIIFTPVDTIKTLNQTDGKNSFKILKNKIKNNNIFVLYHGCLANGLITLIGHYPWFLTHNYLNKYIPYYEDNLVKNLIRNCFIGFVSSMISDTISNGLRVVKTYKQTSEKSKSYKESINEIVSNKNGGMKELFTRGLTIRLITNGIQGIMFNVMWKYFDNKKNKKRKNII